MTTTLYLIRHGRRASFANRPDRECPISSEGRKETESIAKLLSKERTPIPTKVLYSPTRRTEETAEIIAKYFEIEAEVEPLLYFGQDESKLLEKIPSDNVIAFVGHGPALGLFADLLIDGTLPLSGEMRESSALVLQFEGEIGFGKARFIKFLLPESE